MTKETKWDCLDLLEPESGRNDFAFLILNQPVMCQPDLVMSMWKRSSLRITVDGGTNRWLDFVEKNNIQNPPLPHYITGDFDSITARTKAYFEEKKANFVNTPDQDYTDFTKALQHVNSVALEQKLKLTCIIALCETSGRLDQIMANLETLYHSQKISDVPLIEMSSNSLTWLLHAGSHTIHVEDEFVEKNFPCGLIPLSGPTTVTSSGLKWNLDDSILAFGELVSTSNTFSGNVVSIKCDKDLVWTMQYLPEN